MKCYLFFVFILKSLLNLSNSKLRKLQSTIKVLNITNTECSNNTTKIAEIQLTLSSQIQNETLLIGNLTNGTNNFSFNCTIPNVENDEEKTTINCSLDKEIITTVGDYYLSSIVGSKYEYVSNIPLLTILRVGGQTPYILFDSILFKGIEYETQNNFIPDIFLKKNESFYKFSCSKAENSNAVCIPPSNVESGMIYTLSYRDECGNMINNTDKEYSIYGPIKVSGNRYIEEQSKIPFNLTIESNIEGIEYSLDPVPDQFTCEQVNNNLVCTIEESESALTTSNYNLICIIGGVEAKECFKNAIVIYKLLEKENVEVVFEEENSNTTKELNKDKNFTITFPFKVDKIIDDPSSNVRGIRYKSLKQRISLKGCSLEKEDNNDNTKVICTINSEENADVEIQYKNKTESYVTIGKLIFNDPNYQDEQSNSSYYHLSYFLLLGFLL